MRRYLVVKKLPDASARQGRFARGDAAASDLGCDAHCVPPARGKAAKRAASRQHSATPELMAEKSFSTGRGTRRRPVSPMRLTVILGVRTILVTYSSMRGQSRYAGRGCTL